MSQIGGGQVLFSDDFNTNGRIDSNKWRPNVGDGSFLGATQMRPTLPVAKDGVLRLQLDTYNPSGNPAKPTYFGSEAISRQEFSVGNGIAFEGEMRLAQDQRGLIAGFFPFWGDANRHDEIDWELIPNRGLNNVQTNLYVNDTYSGGNWKIHPIDEPMTEFHTFRIEWLPNQVRWYVDGELVRTENQSPTRAMALHLNIWGPGLDWDTADPSLRPTGNPALNQSYFFEVDWVKVEELAAFFGDGAANRSVGSAANDLMRGAGGSDALIGGLGDDTIVGGEGDDEIYGQGGNDRLIGAEHDDALFGNAHNDLMSGGDGNDTLDGGRGSDTMDGGDGTDLFRFDSVTDSPDGPLRDKITDLRPQEGDKIDLSGIDANTNVAGDQEFYFLRQAAFGSRDGIGDAGELRYEVVGNSILLQGDVDGDGVADFEVLLSNLSHIYADSFIL
ncbi:family 16 glycosylhydrolase [Acuticoccus kandeliae]|uniref:family 16 glycosylhydrolase n=1 Tax=Acuticoccus kandeliae TaxID=2073160 RepID=UPI000D3E5D3C|nr:family 16 glycosylhydrolase [Acuticoccus kandeliae]